MAQFPHFGLITASLVKTLQLVPSMFSDVFDRVQVVSPTGLKVVTRLVEPKSTGFWYCSILLLGMPILRRQMDDQCCGGVVGPVHRFETALLWMSYLCLCQGGAENPETGAL